jgi:hypothetical protein
MELVISTVEVMQHGMKIPERLRVTSCMGWQLLVKNCIASEVLTPVVMNCSYLLGCNAV